MVCNDAWAAGLFEGEGCIAYVKGNGRVYPQLRLGMTDEDVVRRFATWAGCGNVRPQIRKNGDQTIFMWCMAAREDVARIINALLPYMGERRSERMREALTYCQSKKSLQMGTS